MFVRHLPKLKWLTRSYSKLVAYKTESTVPFENLAFEEWIYENANLCSTARIFVWRSAPSVVIGRHQNPWAECDVRALRSNDCLLARRQSGGGTVYHDLGNVNVTYFTPRSSYDRRFNLKVIIDAISKKWPAVKLGINCRDDIVVEERYKISGSAAKLGRKNSYHHCTLLIDSNLNDIKQFLHSPTLNIDTKATRSVASPTANLSSYIPDVTYEDVRDAIFEEFFLSFDKNADSGHQPTITSIDPTNNDTFPGISDITSRISSWEWVYGKSPKFEAHWSCKSAELGDLKFTLSVAKGIISSATWCFDPLSGNLLQDFGNAMIGVKFTRHDILNQWLKFQVVSKEKYKKLYMQELGRLVGEILKAL